LAVRPRRVGRWRAQMPHVELAAGGRATSKQHQRGPARRAARDANLLRTARQYTGCAHHSAEARTCRLVSAKPHHQRASKLQAEACAGGRRVVVDPPRRDLPLPYPHSPQGGASEFWHAAFGVSGDRDEVVARLGRHEDVAVVGKGATMVNVMVPAFTSGIRGRRPRRSRRPCRTVSPSLGRRDQFLLTAL
jgi:hypothetical protein